MSVEAVKKSLTDTLEHKGQPLHIEKKNVEKRAKKKKRSEEGNNVKNKKTITNDLKNSH